MSIKRQPVLLVAERQAFKQEILNLEQELECINSRYEDLLHRTTKTNVFRLTPYSNLKMFNGEESEDILLRHNCTKCKLVGVVYTNDAFIGDVYICNKNTLLIRHSSEPSDYSSTRLTDLSIEQLFCSKSIIMDVARYLYSCGYFNIKIEV